MKEMKTRTSIITIIAIVLVASTIVWWTWNRPGLEAISEPMPTIQSGDAGIRIGQPAPIFSLTDLDGNKFMSNDYSDKIVVIDFMATWCGPCRQQMPYYNTVWDNYKDQIVLISISIDPAFDSEEVLQSFTDEFNAPWIWARDESFTSLEYGIHAIPTTVIIDQNNYVRFIHIGVTDDITLIQNIEKLLS